MLLSAILFFFNYAIRSLVQLGALLKEDMIAGYFRSTFICVRSPLQKKYLEKQENHSFPLKDIPFTFSKEFSVLFHITELIVISLPHPQLQLDFFPFF